MKYLFLIFSLSLLLVGTDAWAAMDSDSEEVSAESKSEKSRGYLSGSFETNTTVYHKDDKSHINLSFILFPLVKARFSKRAFTLFVKS